MVQRWKMSPNQSMVTEPDGGYVEYTDHIAAIKELVSLCLDNGIISRGAAIFSIIWHGYEIPEGGIYHV